MTDRKHTAVNQICPDCGCSEDGWNPKRHEFMEPWARCCGYPDREKRQTEASGPALTDVLTALYKSEINASISCFWDGGWTVKLGDEMNGFKAERTFYTLSQAGAWLAAEARKHFPDSDFAKGKANARI